VVTCMEGSVPAFAARTEGSMQLSRSRDRYLKEGLSPLDRDMTAFFNITTCVKCYVCRHVNMIVRKLPYIVVKSIS
jgi:hypothetical protein